MFQQGDEDMADVRGGQSLYKKEAFKMECAAARIDSNDEPQGLVISFPWGMPGLDYKEYRLCALSTDSPFFFLQSTHEPEVGLLLVNPFEVHRDYEFDLSDDVVKQLKIENDKQVAVFCTINTSRGIASATVNLLAPVVVNVERMIGKQIVLNDKKYSLQMPLAVSRGDQGEGS